MLAFDDRSLTRPFGLRDAKAYALPTLGAPLLVLRTPDAWDGSEKQALSLGYAHELLRRRDPTRRPLWFETGLCELASTVEVAPPVVRIGRPLAEHLILLRDRPLPSLRSTFDPSDFAGWSEPARALFAARAWAVAHYLTLRDARGARVRALDRYREALDAQERDPLAAAFGDPSALAGLVHEHVRRDRFQEIGLRTEWSWQADAAQLAPVAPARARSALGELALALERPALARDYFERALRADARDLRAQRGLVAALRLAGRVEQAAAQLERARALAPDDPATGLETAELALARAQAAAGAAERAEAAAAARARFRELLARAPNAAAAELGLARSYLVEGEASAEGRPAIARARSLAPGSLEVDLVEARLAARSGRSAEARLIAAEVWLRSPAATTRAAAREILDSLE